MFDIVTHKGGHRTVGRGIMPAEIRHRPHRSNPLAFTAGTSGNMGCCSDVFCLPCNLLGSCWDALVVVFCCPCRCCCGCPKTETEEGRV